MTTTERPARVRRNGVDHLIVALVVAPFLVAAVAIATGAYANFDFVGDNALNQLRIADVGHHSVLLGPYARDGWSHPGPAMYYLLAVPYQLAGSRAVGIVIGALAINGASAALMVALARALGGRGLMVLVALGVALVTVRLGPEFVRDPWNPYLAVLPFGLVIMSCWALADGRWWQLPVVAGVGTFCVQTHIGYVPLVLPLAVWAIVAVVVRRRTLERRSRATVRRPALVTGGVLAVMWAPTVIDQFAGDGNITTIRRYFVDGDAAKGFDVAGRVLAETFSLAPGWLTGHHSSFVLTGEPTSVGRWSLPLLGLVLVVIAVVAWPRETHGARLGMTAISISVAASFVALARTTGRLYDYRLRFLWVVGVLATALGVWLALRLTRRDGPTTHGILLVALGVVSVVAVVDATTGDPPDVVPTRRLDAVTPAVLERLPRRAGPYTIQATSLSGAHYVAGLAVRLEAAGRTVVFPRSRVDRLTFGEHRARSTSTARTITVATGSGVDHLVGQAGAREIGHWGAESQAHRRRDASEIRRILAAGPIGGQPASARRRLQRLLSRTEVLAIFVTT